MKLQNKTALITGSTKGIGKAIAKKMVAEGANVMLNYGRDRESAEKALKEFAEAYPKVKVSALAADNSKLSDIENLFSKTVQEFGGIDIVVVNAGIELIDIPFVDYTEEQYDRVFNINTKGTFFAMQQAAKHLNQNGRIILISSSTTAYPHAGFAVYGGSKTAPKFFVEVLAKELGEKGITVNSVIPGATDNAGIFADMPDDHEYKKEIRAASPLNKMGQPEDIADVTAFVASEESSFITGHHFMVNGGAVI